MAFLLPELAGDAFAELLVRQRQLEQAQVLDVALVVGDHAFLRAIGGGRCGRSRR